MKLDKKQVKAILDILKENKNRPALNRMIIQSGKAYITDSYSLVSYTTELGNGCIYQQDIETWYKLASAKDIFNDNEAEKILTQEEDVKIASPSRIGNLMDVKEYQKVDHFNFNYKILDRVKKAVSSDPLTTIRFEEKGSRMFVYPQDKQNYNSSVEGMVLAVRFRSKGDQ